MFYLESKDAQLFVYLTWKTQNANPILNDDELRQATHLAITARTRSHLCHVLAIESTPSQIYLVIHFPPSLAISEIVRISRCSAGQAISRLHEVLHGQCLNEKALWEHAYTTHSLNASEAAEAQGYLRRQIALAS